ncbi:MAG: hypothetical protein HGGPFJEG_01700 [Ignavibacteria bacterium]|nr:hypothetical protein [Ignavibacteria bacterium]
MESRTTERFRKCFQNLPKKIKNQARAVFKVWETKPDQKSLKFKKIHSKENIYSIRIGLNWRAVGVKNDEQMIWFWIGSHSDYNNLIKRL